MSSRSLTILNIGLPQGRRVRLLFRRGARLVGVAPFLVYPRGAERVLTLMGAGISDDQDILPDGIRRWLERADARQCLLAEDARALYVVPEGRS